MSKRLCLVHLPEPSHVSADEHDELVVELFGDFAAILHGPVELFDGL
jgi:hypothetical protein